MFHVHANSGHRLQRPNLSGVLLFKAVYKDPRSSGFSRKMLCLKSLLKDKAIASLSYKTGHQDASKVPEMCLPAVHKTHTLGRRNSTSHWGWGGKKAHFSGSVQGKGEQSREGERCRLKTAHTCACSTQNGCHHCFLPWFQSN